MVSYCHCHSNTLLYLPPSSSHSPHIQLYPYLEDATHNTPAIICPPANVSSKCTWFIHTTLQCKHLHWYVTVLRPDANTFSSIFIIIIICVVCRCLLMWNNLPNSWWDLRKSTSGLVNWSACCKRKKCLFPKIFYFGLYMMLSFGIALHFQY